MYTVMEQVKALVTLDKVLLSIFIALLWGLFTVPFILFYTSEGLEVANMTDMMANMTDLSGPQMMTNTSEETNMSCSEDFYFEESKNYCVPDCYSWTSYSPVQTRAVDAMIIISCCVAILSITAVLIISCIRRKTVMKFPSILVSYLSLTSLLFYSTILVGYTNRYDLYCTSRDIEENFLKPTPYCLFSGTIFHFKTIEMLIWWLSHVVVLFFMIYFPLQAKRFLSSREVHYVHAVILMVGFLVPTIPPLVTLLSGIRDESDPERLGYRVAFYPPNICFSIRADIEFYTINVPSNIMLTTGVTFLLLIFWKLYKQRHTVEKSRISTTEAKILTSFTYFTLLHITTSTLSVHYNNTTTEVGNKLFSYFVCARYNEHCTKPDLADTYHPVGVIMAWVVRACLPIFLLVYVINCEVLKRGVKKKRNTIRNMSEAASSKAQTAG